MRNWAVIAILLLAFQVGCGGSGSTDNFTGDTDVTTSEDTGNTEEDTNQQQAQCLAAIDCEGKVEPGPCQKAICEQGMCKVQAVENGIKCDDGNGCTIGDTCYQGNCSGETVDCDDNNPCTKDSCSSETGECEFTPQEGSCNDGNQCTSGDHCDAGECVSGENQCDCLGDSDCEKYDDGDLCNGVMICSNSQCVIAPNSVVDCSGIQVPACQEVFCDPDEGMCKTKKLSDGKTCDDGNACTKSDTCDDGVCMGDMIDYNDGNECTVDSCDPATGATHVNEANGTTCSDGDLCTVNDSCQDGVCEGEANPQCQCETTADCAAVEDGNLCNGTLVCAGGQCLIDPETVVTCAAATEQCKKNTCNPATGLCVLGNVLSGTPCDDENACTELDFCSAGVCSGEQVVVNDDNPCTEDSCDPVTGPEFTPVQNGTACDDLDACTSNDACVDGDCTGDLDQACECLTKDDCNDLNDENICNGTLTCVNNHCVVDPATVITCADLEISPCESAVCEPETGFCVVSAKEDGDECDDDDECTVNDTCSQGDCKGQARICDDDNICTNDSCDPIMGCVYEYNHSECDDGNDCTLNDACIEGVCTGDPSDQCQCAATEDCAQFEDGDLCNGSLICVAFKCIIDQESVVECDTTGDNTCNVTMCDPTSGACVQNQLEDGKPCNDDNTCTEGDVCLAGECVATGQKVCNDSNPCTDDGCDPVVGCTFISNTEACDDGDPCTGGDLCQDGVCQPGDQDNCGGETCIPDWTLSCGETDMWGTDLSGATDVIDSYSCSPFDYTGPEYTYTYTAPYDGMIKVKLSDEEAETDIMVLESMGEGCDPENCRDYGFSTVEFEAMAGTTYFFVVDGFEDGFLPGEGSYTIEVECTPLSELVCDDGEDDDQDGLTDCDDDDCLGTEACPLPLCDPSWSLECGESDSWTNYGPGSTNQVDTYSCNDWTFSGPEYTYSFLSPVSKTITVSLTEESAETDIMVVASDDNICDPTTCITSDYNEVTFDAVAGTLYYLVVDGFSGAEGSYTISVACPPDVELDCTNGEDDDQDSLTDCDDDDCAFNDACLQDCNPVWDFPVECGFEENWRNYGFLSSNKVDAYSCTGDQMTGPEYVYTFEAPYSGQITVTLTDETAETDLMVIEADEDLACAPSNCIGHEYDTVTFTATQGKTYFIVVDGFDGAEGSYHFAISCVPVAELNCTDGIDDDEDGLADCLDEDCFGNAECPACQPDSVEFAQLTCDSVDYFTNDGDGSTNLIDTYGCNIYDYPAPEYTYTLTVDSDTMVAIELDNEVDGEGDPADLDILVLEDAGLGCNPSGCLTWGMNSVEFQAEAGVTYYVVIDGYEGSVGYYDLAVTCQ